MTKFILLKLNNAHHRDKLQHGDLTDHGLLDFFLCTDIEVYKKYISKFHVLYCLLKFDLLFYISILYNVIVLGKIRF